MIEYSPNPWQSEYRTAMQTEEWKWFREQCFKRDGYKCRICGCKQNLEPHHVSYQGPGGELLWFEPKAAVTLCRKCHSIITDAIEAAKHTQVSVPSFTPSRWKAGGDYGYLVNKAISKAESDVVTNACFELWKRTLANDAETVNMRNYEVTRAVGDIVKSSIENQTGLRATYSNYILNTQTMITDYIIDGYKHYREQGFTDDDVARFFKLNDGQMARLKKHLEKIGAKGGDRNV